MSRVKASLAKRRRRIVGKLPKRAKTSREPSYRISLGGKKVLSVAGQRRKAKDDKARADRMEKMADKTHRRYR